MIGLQDVARHVGLGLTPVVEEVWFADLCSRRHLHGAERDRWDARFCVSGDNNARKRKASALRVEPIAGHGKIFSDGKSLLKKLVTIHVGFCFQLPQVLAGFVYRKRIAVIRDHYLRAFFRPSPVAETYRAEVERLDNMPERGFLNPLTVRFPEDRLLYVISAMVHCCLHL